MANAACALSEEGCPGGIDYSRIPDPNTHHPIDSIEPLVDGKDRAEDAVNYLLLWLTRVSRGKRLNRRNARGLLEMMAVRAAAMVYAVRPEYLGGKPAAYIARSLGVNKRTFSYHLGDFMQTMHYHRAHIRGDKARENMRAARLRAMLK